MKNILKRYIPSATAIKKNKKLGWIKDHLHHPSLWSFSRRAISRAFAIGLFMAFIPIPFQMLLAAPTAVLFSANLPISIALVWITNPATMPIIYYGCYKLGSWMMDVQIESDFIMSVDYLLGAFNLIWQPFLLGCITVSAVTSIMGYYGVQLFYRYKAYRRSRKNSRDITR